MNVIDDKYKDVLETAVGSVEALKRTGLKLIEARDRYAKALMPLAGNVNHVGMMYAGSLFSLGEVAGGLLHVVSFDYTRLFPIVKEVHIRFRRPALSDITMEASLTEERVDQLTREAEETGKAEYSLELELKDVNGEVVSIVTGTWQIRVIPEGMKGWA